MNKLNPRSQISALPKIKLGDGTLSQNLNRILKEFHSDYNKLYQKIAIDFERSLHKFLEQTHLPKLTTQHVEIMDKPFTHEEHSQVLETLKLKSPGPDGLSNGYYKKYADILIPHLVLYFNHLREGNNILNDENITFIRVIPKPHKDHTEISNYRPISLIN